MKAWGPIKRLKVFLQIAAVFCFLVVYGNNCGRSQSSSSGGAPSGVPGNSVNLASCLAQSNKVCTYFGFSPEMQSGLPGLQTPIRAASKLAFDKNGDLLFYSGALNGIYRYHVSTGIVSLIAGDGTVQTPYGGADAKSSGLLTVNGIAVDSHNNIYWSSAPNGIIYKIDANTNILRRFLGTGHVTGAVCTSWAEGTPATSVDPCGLGGIAFDSFDNLYFIDTGGPHKIYKMANGSGLVTTYAGGGAASPGVNDTNCDGTTSSRLAFPTVLSMAPDNNDLYVTTYYGRVCKVVAGQPLKLVHVAGDGSNANTGDGGLPTSAGIFFSSSAVVESGPSPRYIYIASGKLIRRIDTSPLPAGSPPVITTIGGTDVSGQPVSNTPVLSANFATINSSALSPVTGELFIASGTMIYKVRSSDQMVQALVGLVPNVQVTNSPRDFYSNWVTGLSGRLSFSDDESKIYVPLSNQAKIVSIEFATGIVNNLIGTGTSGVNGDGAVSTTMIRIPKTVRNYNGAVYFSDAGTFTIRKLQSAVVTTVAGTLGVNGGARGAGDGGLATAAILSNVISDFDIDPISGNFFVVDNIDIRKFSLGGNISTEYTAIDQVTGFGIHQRSLAILNNTVYFLGDDCKLRSIPAAGGAMAVVAGTGTCGYSGDGGPMTAANLSPWTLQVWNGKLFLIDATYGKVIRYFNFSTGNIELVAGTPGIGGYSPDLSSFQYLPTLGVTGLKSDGSFVFWDTGRGLLRGWQRGFAPF